MLSKLNAAGEAVAHQLIRAETASDAIVQETATLNATIIEARTMARRNGDKIALTVGQGAMSDIAEAHVLATRARFHLGRAHHRMAIDAHGLGLDWTAWGDETDTPPMVAPVRFASEAEPV